jgi:hypothetical protein
MNSGSLPEALRRAVEADLVPVRPLLPTWMRLLIAAAVAAGGLAAAAVGLQLTPRPDLQQIPLWLSWGCSALQLAVAVLLIAMALREAVPGSGPPGGSAALAVTAGVVVQVLVGIATWVHSPGAPLLPGRGLAAGLGCASHDAVVGAPALIITMWLVFRALPVRPALAGLLGGAGAAVGADAFNHLVCPMSDLRHVLVWHTGALLGLMLIGWGIGYVWERRRSPRP